MLTSSCGDLGLGALARRLPRHTQSLLLLMASCGYHAVYASAGPGRLHVRLVRSLVPDAVASDEVTSGMREELAREGALEPGDGWPRAEIEVLRATETSEGIAGGLVGKGGAPSARGIDVAMVARAWIRAAPGDAPVHDTGDMRSEEVIAVGETSCGGACVAAGGLDPRASGFERDDAFRAAARRLGSALARKVMGQPAASENSDR